MITINADCQVLSICQCDPLVSDSIDVLEVQFVFDNCWAGMVKVAQFTQKNSDGKFETYNQLINDMGIAPIPNEIKDGICIISVFGTIGNKRMTTAPLAVPVKKSGFIGDGTTPIPPTPDLYQQLLAEFMASSYELPTASADGLGGIKVGQGLEIDADGKLHTTGGGKADSVEWSGVQNKPETFPPTEHKHTAEDVPGLSAIAKSGSYNDLKDRPAFFPPADHTHTAEAVGALPAGGTAANAEKLGGKAPEYYMPAVNLLDNSDFRNPTNQRGGTSYTGGTTAAYWLDRWQFGRCNASLVDGGLSVAWDGANGNNGYFQQAIGHQMKAGETYTIGVKVDGQVQAYPFTVPDDASKNLYFDTNLIRLMPSGGIRWLVFYSYTTTAKVYEWVALYEGEYTTETLPPYVPKGYTAELAECKRYYRRIKNAIVQVSPNIQAYYRASSIFYEEMRMAPTVTILVNESGQYGMCSNVAYITDVNDISIVNRENGCLGLATTKENYAGRTIQIYDIALSADL